MGVKAPRLTHVLTGCALTLTLCVMLLGGTPRRQVRSGADMTDTDVLQQIDNFQRNIVSNLSSLRRHFDVMVENMSVSSEPVNRGGVDDVTASKVRILFLVITSPQNLETRARDVQKTWGKRADNLVFVSSETNTSFPTVGVDVQEGRDHLTGKTMRGLAYVHDHHLQDADWFMKCDDDTFVIVENLQKFLSDKDSGQLVYYGHLFRPIVKQGYHSGGAGYVISKAALTHFYHNGGLNPEVCVQDGAEEDVDLGICMEKLGVKATNGTDPSGLSLFHTFDPEQHILGEYEPWYFNYDASGGKKGLHSISEYAISFHYMDSHLMMLMELLVYRMKIQGEDDHRRDTADTVMRR